MRVVMRIPSPSHFCTTFIFIFYLPIISLMITSFTVLITNEQPSRELEISAQDISSPADGNKILML